MKYQEISNAFINIILSVTSTLASIFNTTIKQ